MKILPFEVFRGAHWRERKPRWPKYLSTVLHFDLSPFPVLTTPRLLLRALSAEDAPALFRMRSDPRVMHYIPKPLFIKAAEAKELLEGFQRAFARHEQVMWAITLKGTNETCGIIGYWRILAEHHRAEIGYFIDPAQWNQGLMTEAVAAVLDLGFGRMGLHSVEAATDPANTASIRVLERNGFVREGRFKQNIRSNAVFVDSVVYSRLASGTQREA